MDVQKDEIIPLLPRSEDKAELQRYFNGVNQTLELLFRSTNKDFTELKNDIIALVGLDLSDFQDALDVLEAEIDTAAATANAAIEKAILTEQGDIIYSVASANPTVLHHGNAGDLLKSGGHAANPSWVSPAGIDSGAMQKAILTEKGDIIYASAASTPAALPHGSAGQVLTSGGHGANPSWEAAGVSDHGNLTGLTPDDDHPQYALLAGRTGSVAFTSPVSITETTKTAKCFYSGTTTPDGTDRLNYNGYFYATKFYNAVWNDYADYWPAAPNTLIVPGKVYSQTTDGLIIANRKSDKRCVGICTDTYGFAVGEKSKSVPISVAGFALGYVDEKYEAGTPLTSTKIGTLTRANFLDVLRGRVVAKYIKEESRTYIETVYVCGRHWVKVV